MKFAFLFAALVASGMASTIDWQFISPVVTIPNGEIQYYDTYIVQSYQSTAADYSVIEIADWTQGEPQFSLTPYGGNDGNAPQPGFEEQFQADSFGVVPPGTVVYAATGLVPGATYLLTIDNTAAGQDIEFQLNENLFGTSPVDPPPHGSPTEVPEPGAWMEILALGVVYAVSHLLLRRRKRG
jgi:hypothetical protein